MRFLFLILVALFAVNFSCKKGEFDKDAYFEAVVFDAGSPSYDGCGWLIKIDDISYSPVNLSEKFKTNNLDVLVYYEKLDTWIICGFPTESSPKVWQVKIIDMKYR